MYLYYRAFSLIYDTLGGKITNEAKHVTMSLITFTGNIADVQMIYIYSRVYCFRQKVYCVIDRLMDFTLPKSVLYSFKGETLCIILFSGYTAKYAKI